MPRIEPENLSSRLITEQTRRQFFHTSGVSLGSLALTSMLAAESSPVSSAHSLSVRPTHHAPRAKRVIFLFMVGGPSQLDLFEYKPEITRREGEPLPESYLKKAKSAFAQIQASRPRLLGTPWKFARHGQSGTELSELLPHTAKIVDHITILRNVTADETNHFFAELQVNTGQRNPGGAGMGAWVTYGLGSMADDLPGFVVLNSNSRPRSKGATYSNGFLPSAYQGVPLRPTGDPIINLASPPGFPTQRQRRSIDAIKALNDQQLGATGDTEIAARVSAYEMAFRLQLSAPELMDLSGESAETLALYGIGNTKQPSFARDCLLARRLAERGTRFVQINFTDWDHHSHLLPGLPNNCKHVDQAAAGLVLDLKRRGLLDDTLVIWGGEMGRSSVAQATNKEHIGRDHHLSAFTMWMAGGGVKSGATIGSTEELGCFPTDTSDVVHVHDLHATMLHLLGLDHERLTYRFQGRDFRLTDVYGEVFEKALA
jgi:hypothetical protein